MLKRCFPLVLIFVLLASPAAAVIAQPDYVPIEQEAYVADLEQAGYHNGEMPLLRMIDVGGCLLERDAAYTLSLMIETARLDDVDLAAHDCYRSYSAQSAAYERRCPVEEEEIVELDPVTGEETVVGIKRTRTCSGPPIARAGHSNHGWGRAVDFGNGARVLACGDPQFVWLEENAGRFGWVHPSWAHCGMPSREPWHWEWGGVTDALPLPPALIRTPPGSDARYR